MHPALKVVHEKVVEWMEADGRVLAGCLQGSAGSASEDPLSDVDATFLVAEENFESLDGDLPDLFRPLCDEIVLWWPERSNRFGHHNFAVLFRLEDRLLQYDITITVPPPGSRRQILPYQFIFDKAGVLEVVPESRVEPYAPGRVQWLIEQYWVWIYIHAKYFKRSDMIKLVYVQQELFNVHLDLLRAEDGPLRATRWWPLSLKTVKNLELREFLLRYLQHSDIDSVRRQLPGQIARFRADALRIATYVGIPYPAEAEKAILAHLADCL